MDRPAPGTIVTCRHQQTPHVINEGDRWCQDPFPIGYSGNGREYRPWTEIEGDLLDPRVAEKYETVCIWCGITCVSIEALEEHEETCE
jgi:hypothetical protein